ncbi:MAG: inorganic diphosphatase [Gammaproteobacteria bacterium]|nr:MAG: inorganic diphosphatase [Gammaproteobacteria bacterium]
MSYDKLSPGSDVPEEVNVVIEIPANSDPVKYEIDKDSGTVMVDRFMAAPMFYPCNYGYIPGTLSEDGDPIDVLVHTPYPLVHGSVIACRPIGVLNMKDEAGPDAKLVALPKKKLTPLYDHINSVDDLPALLKQQIEHFFTRYKELEKGKWVEINDWAGADEARRQIVESVERAGKA